MEYLSETKFSSLNDKISERTLKAITEMGFEKMTEIQAKTIPNLLDGRDTVASAKTGSGKTLAFLIPAVERMYDLKFKPRNGTGILVISPTRELSMQTFGVLKQILKYHSQTHCLLMGGGNRHTEGQKLSTGANIVIATPGRLLDHMKNTNDFRFDNLQCLIIDEADRILDIGFEEEMKKIIRLLPKIRQTMLFSATFSEKTKNLVSVAMNGSPLYVGVEEKEEKATVEGLKQGYIVCPSERQFHFLYSFLRKHKEKKIMVFFSSCMSVKFHYELLNYIEVPVSSIYGKQKQSKRTLTFFKFCNAKSGILLCTDVAARGLDIPDVDWIIQYNPPDDPKEYIHRVGRTARGEKRRGSALLILRPEELELLQYLKHARVPIHECEFSWKKIANVQTRLEEIVTGNCYLQESAKEGYRSYVRAYRSHHMKNVYNIQTLDLTAVAKSFGFPVAPSLSK